MEQIFADAFYWIALANPADEWHSAVSRFDKENPPLILITTEEVLTEFVNYFSGSGTHRRRIVASMVTRLIEHPMVIVLPQTTESFHSGFELFKNREDKGYSLTDCMSMAAMHERNIRKVLTHDGHFVQEGFEIQF